MADETTYLDLGFDSLLQRGGSGLDSGSVSADGTVDSLSDSTLTISSGGSYNGNTDSVEDFVSTEQLLSGDTGSQIRLSLDGYLIAGADGYDDGSGFFLGWDRALEEYVFFIGDSTGNNLTWDGTTLTVTGTIIAGAGAIGGWNITTDTLYSLASGTPTSSPTDGIILDSSNPVIQIYEDAALRIEIGYLSAGVFGIKGYDTGGANVLFELSDTQNLIAGWTISTTTLANSTNIVLDASNKAISINDQTFGNAGVQLEYNGGTPRAYIGDGATYFFNFDGTNISWGAVATTLDTAGKLTTTSADIGGWEVVTGYIYNLQSGTPTATPNDGVVIASGNEAFIVYEDTAKRAELGYLAAGVYGLKVYATDGTTVIFEASDTQQNMAGWTFDNTALYNLASGTPAATPNDGLVLLANSTPAVIAYENTQKRVEMGYLTAGVFGFKGYADNGTTVIFEMSDTQQRIGGWYFTDTTLADNATAANANVLIDSASSIIRLGPTAADYVTLDGANQRLRSSNYVSGMAGAGFTLEPDLLEVGNIAARGIIRTAVFQKDIISSVGGNFIVVDSDVLAADMDATDAETLTIEGNTTFVNGDILRIKDGTDDEWMTITDATGAPTYVVDRDEAGDYGADANPAWTTGATVVNYRQSGDGFVYMTASETNAPYIQIGTHAGAPWTTIATQARLGNLNGYLGYAADIYGLGVGSTTAGEANITIEPTNGIRMRTGATLLFQIDMAGGATIAGWDIAAASLTATSGEVGMSSAVTGGDDIRFWAGHATPASAPFYVTEAGALVATSATITGAITATTGAIGGWVITATQLADAAGVVGISSAVTGGDDIRFWAGDVTPGSAEFRVYESGALVASSATITGAITATTGAIGGWVVTATQMADAAGVVGMSSAVTGGDDVRFWAGHATPTSAPFYVTEAGALVATSATITGAISATSGAIGGWTIDATSIYTGTEDHAAYTANAGDITIYSDGANSSIHANSFYIDAAGVLNCTAAVIAGGITTTAGSSLDGQYLTAASVASAAANLAMRGWVQTSAFSITDADTVAWGAGILTASDGTAYSIDAGNTGNMAAKTYIYLDIAVSITVYQITTTAATATGNGKLLVAIAENAAVEATYMLMNDNSYNIDAANIIANSITANEIAATTITGTQISTLAISGKSCTFDTGTVGGWTMLAGYLYDLASGTPTASPNDGIVLASGNAGLIVYENTEKRVEVGYLSAGVYGIRGYADDGTTALFELSDTQLFLAGWTVSATTLANGTDIVLDASNKAISINDTTFGNAGVQIQYNAGTPRMHVGSTTKYMQFDGTNLNVVSGVVDGATTINSSTATNVQFRAEALFNQDFVYSGRPDDSDTALTEFMSATTGGGLIIRTLLMSLLQSNTGGAWARLSGSGEMASTFASATVTWAEMDLKFYVNAEFDAATSQDAFLGLYDKTVAAGNLPANATSTDRHIGFYIQDGVIYASNADGTTQQKTDVTGGYTMTNMNFYWFEFDTGTDIKFYINDDLVHTETSNLPTTNRGVPYMGIAEDGTANRAMVIKNNYSIIMSTP